MAMIVTEKVVVKNVLEMSMGAKRSSMLTWTRSTAKTVMQIGVEA